MQNNANYNHFCCVTKKWIRSSARTDAGGVCNYSPEHTQEVVVLSVCFYQWFCFLFVFCLCPSAEFALTTLLIGPNTRSYVRLYLFH